MLTTKDVAEQLNVSEKTVRNWIDEGLLEGFKLGKNYRIEPEAVQEFLNKSKIKKEEVM